MLILPISIFSPSMMSFYLLGVDGSFTFNEKSSMETFIQKILFCIFFKFHKAVIKQRQISQIFFSA